MGDEVRNAGIIVGAEVVRALLYLAFEEARRRGLSAEQSERLYFEERQKFLASDPNKIPDV